MELQGKKVTHDFLSLYASDSSFQLQDARPSSQGFFLKTRDFLQPLDRSEEKGGEAAAAAAAVPVTGPAERVLPAGYTIGAHVVADGVARVTRGAFPIGLETKPEPDYGSRSSTASYGSYAGAASYALWDDKDTASRGQWPSHFAAAARGSGNAGPISAAGAVVGGRHESALEKKRLMEGAASGSSRGYDGLDDDEEFGKREGSSSRKDLAIRVDGKASCTSSQDQRPNTPRSKHSATEQRRRSKINDRFQILREIIPHSDQKRDKASFLLEVIEYIRFLQEKVHRYESSYPGWSQDNAKLMPWHNGSQAPASGLLMAPAHVVNNENTPALVFPPKNDEMSIPVVAPTLLSAHSLPKKMEIATPFGSNLASTNNLLQPNFFRIGKETSTPQSQQKKLSEEENMASQDRSPWSRTCCLSGCGTSRQMLNESEELTIDEGTISLSTSYSHGLLTTLSQALQSSGVDLSQANISVKINLGRRAVSWRPTAATTTSSIKDPEKDPAPFDHATGYSSRIKPGDGESSQAPKRLKAHG